MNKGPDKGIIKLLVTIVDRGQGNKVVKLNEKEHLYVQFVCLGHGTASSEILDYLGLGETEKDVVVSLVPEAKAPGMLTTIRDKMQLNIPGKGIAFTVPLSGISGIVSQLVVRESETTTKREDKRMDFQADYSLIIAVVNNGYSEEVMAAARTAGATGGTVIHARGINSEEVEKFLGISIQAEREIIAIIARKEDKHNIMKAIAQAAGLKTPARGVVMSLPVDHVAGLN